MKYWKKKISCNLERFSGCSERLRILKTENNKLINYIILTPVFEVLNEKKIGSINWPPMAFKNTSFVIKINDVVYIVIYCILYISYDIHCISWYLWKLKKI